MANMTSMSINLEIDVNDPEEEILVSISQSGQIDPTEWGSARECLLRRLDQVCSSLWPYLSTQLTSSES
jgi:hypothetical protein